MALNLAIIHLICPTAGFVPQAVVLSTIPSVVLWSWFDPKSTHMQKESGPKLVEWKKVLVAEKSFQERIAALKSDVEALAGKFPIPGRGDF